jgi:hypothetical protein
MAMFTISSNAFHMQEWSNLARDKISCLCLTLPLASFYGWFWLVLAHHFSPEGENSMLLQNVGFYHPGHTAP